MVSFIVTIILIVIVFAAGYYYYPQETNYIEDFLSKQFTNGKEIIKETVDEERLKNNISNVNNSMDIGITNDSFHNESIIN